MDRKTVYILVGPSSSGKTHYVNKLRKQNCTIISADDVKKELYNDEWSWFANHGVFKEMLLRLKRVLPKEYLYTKIIYIDHTNLTLQMREQYYKIIKRSKIPCDIIILIIKTPIEVCIERNKKREVPIPEKIIERQFRKYQYPHEIDPKNILIINGVGIGEGGNHAILANRSNTNESSTSNTMGSSNSNANNSNNKLDFLPLSEEQINTYLKFLFRLRRKIGSKRRGSFLTWFKKKD